MGVWVGLEAVVIGFARTVLRIFSMSSRLGFGFPLLSDFLFIFPVSRNLCCQYATADFDTSNSSAMCFKDFPAEEIEIIPARFERQRCLYDHDLDET